ncbi:DNA cytosine methyltransferase [Flavonifractor sp. An100]|uniref:DNA cytosine methyltransferase n=1 Tax=Flavonifractor sp. An100 TaxID=1965538 RepID=UPI001FA8ABA5|nr:DNA cytosine methyltransferase [Flavonifractor sp. An100]
MTETESERLMGLPESWTKYGADGEAIRPLQRYKALGNAIALPCADYIMAGINGTQKVSTPMANKKSHCQHLK